MYEEGWEYDYWVTEEVSAEKTDSKWVPSLHRPDYKPGWEYDDGFGMGKPTLKIDIASLRVHHVRAVQFETTDYLVRRHRWEKHEPF